LLLIVLAAMAMLSFVVTLITANAIAEVQRQYQEDVTESTKAQLNLLYRRLQEELSEASVDLDSIEGQRMLEGHVSAVLEPTNDFVQIVITDPRNTRGTLLLSNDRGRITVTQSNTVGLDETVRKLARPLYAQGQLVGAISYKLNSEKMLSRLEISGRQIRRSLTGLSVVLLGLMLATFFLLWKMFKRHMEMTMRASQLRQMAYVGSLAAGLAHEIRNPLHAMGINLSVVEEDIADPRDDSPARVAELVSKLRRQVGELNTTVSAFLEYARPEKSSYEPMDLSKLVDRVCQTVRPQLEAIGGRMTCTSQPPAGAESGSTVIMGQPASIAQMLTNIVTNAVQAMDEKRRRVGGGYQPVLTVALTHRPGGTISITVSDNGPGIKPGEQKKIFDVFYSQKPGGSGFGLAIAKRVATDHGGKIVVESQPGQGATFHILLHQSPPAEPPPAQRPA